MRKDKIENNPSYKKLKRNIVGAEAFQNFLKFLTFLGFKNNEMDEAFSNLPDLKKQIKLITESPDKFNQHYAKRGWIAHESMNSDLMLTSIQLAENGLIEIAEIELINYYTSEKIYSLLY